MEAVHYLFKIITAMFGGIFLVIGAVASFVLGLFLLYIFFMYLPERMIDSNWLKKRVQYRSIRVSYVAALYLFGPPIALAALVLFMKVMGWKFY